MGWNGSDSATGARPSNVRAAGGGAIRATKFRGALAGLIAVIVGAVVVVCFFPRSGKRVSSVPEKAKPARVVLPSGPKTNSVRVASSEAGKEKPYKDLSREEKLKYWRDKYGDNLPDNIKPIVYYLEHPPQKTYRGRSRPEAIFHHKSERQIAAFLNVTPGNWMMRPKVFDKRFDDDFVKALAEKIDITPDDTEEQRRLKQMVIDAKNELAERLKAGETPSAIMTATAKELYDLGQYRRTLQKEVLAAQHDPNLSDQEVADTIAAANKMLEAKGLKGLRTIHPAIRQAQLAIRAEKAAQKAAQSESSKGK